MAPNLNYWFVLDVTAISLLMHIQLTFWRHACKPGVSRLLCADHSTPLYTVSFVPIMFFVYLFEYPRHLLAIVSHTRLPEFTSKERWRLILDDVNIMTVPLMIYKTQWQAETWLRNTRTAGAISSAWYHEKIKLVRRQLFKPCTFKLSLNSFWVAKKIIFLRLFGFVLYSTNLRRLPLRSTYVLTNSKSDLLRIMLSQCYSVTNSSNCLGLTSSHAVSIVFCFVNSCDRYGQEFDNSKGRDSFSQEFDNSQDWDRSYRDQEQRICLQNWTTLLGQQRNS